MLINPAIMFSCRPRLRSHLTRTSFRFVFFFFGREVCLCVARTHTLSGIMSSVADVPSMGVTATPPPSQAPAGPEEQAEPVSLLGATTVASAVGIRQRHGCAAQRSLYSQAPTASDIRCRRLPKIRPPRRRTELQNSITPHQKELSVPYRVWLERPDRRLSENVPLGVGIVLGAE